MDMLTTGITVSTGLATLSPALGRLGFSLAEAMAKGIQKAQVNMFQFGLAGKPVIPTNPEMVEMTTFKLYKHELSDLRKGTTAFNRKFRKPLISKQPIIRTETQNVRITRKKKIVTRVRHKGLKDEKIPHYSEVKRIRKLKRGKTNVGPAKGVATPTKLKEFDSAMKTLPRKLNAFSELKVCTPGKTYSMIEKGPLLNISQKSIGLRPKNIRFRQYILRLKRLYGLN